MLDIYRSLENIPNEHKVKLCKLCSCPIENCNFYIDPNEWEKGIRTPNLRVNCSNWRNIDELRLIMFLNKFKCLSSKSPKSFKSIRK